MFRAVRHASALAIVCCVTGPLQAADETLSHETIAKRAKAATTLVVVESNHGLGFCVNSSGLFVTNEHVVPADAEIINLVFNVELKTEKMLKAQVVRRDKTLDLALLRVKDTEQFEALELGSDKELGELAELIACGLSFGTGLARPAKYPAINISVGSVTSLRQDRGELHRIQLDAALNPRDSGGAVLDRGGKVVGMVVGSTQGSGIHLAIPVSHLRRFLARPEFVFTPPTVKVSNQHEPFEFTAKATALLPSREALDLELILGAGPGKERRFPMKLVDGIYRARAVPFPAREGPLALRVEVKYQDRSVSGIAEERSFRVGPREFKLSQLRSLRLGPKPEVRLADGQRLEGKPSDLETVTLRVGTQPMRLDLANAVEVNVDLPEELVAIPSTIVARQGSAEVGHFAAMVCVGDLCRAVPPKLLSPAVGATLDNNSQNRPRSGFVWEFSWSEVPGAAAYHLYVMGRNARVPLINKEVNSLSYRHVSKGYVGDVHLKDWTWKLRSQVNGQWSEWSEVREFDVRKP